MTRFDTLFAPALDLMFEQHSAVVNYEGVPRIAIVGPEAGDTDTYDGDRERRRSRTIAFRASEITNWARGHQIEIDSEIWTVEERLEASGGLIRFRATRPERVEGGGRSAGR